MIGAPASATVMARISSRQPVSASCSWRRQCARKAWSRHQSVESKARRAAATAASASSGPASAAVPSTSSVAGLTVSNTAPLAASTSSPSISSRLSCHMDLVPSIFRPDLNANWQRWSPFSAFWAANSGAGR